MDRSVRRLRLSSSFDLIWSFAIFWTASASEITESLRREPSSISSSDERKPFLKFVLKPFKSSTSSTNSPRFVFESWRCFSRASQTYSANLYQNWKWNRLGEIQCFWISWAADPCWSGTMWIKSSDGPLFLRVPSSAEFFGLCICSDLEVTAY